MVISLSLSQQPLSSLLSNSVHLRKFHLYDTFHINTQKNKKLHHNKHKIMTLKPFQLSAENYTWSLYFLSNEKTQSSLIKKIFNYYNT